MLRNYLTIAFRHLLRNKIYTIINLLGLAIGMACCLLIMLYVQDELGYDTYHPDADRIYRMALERKYPGRQTSYAIIPHSYAAAVEKERPEVELSTRIFDFANNNPVTLKVGETVYEEGSVLWADSTFFQMFGIRLITGEAQEVLREPFSVVLTDSLAHKYFRNQNPIGQIITLPQNDNDWVVRGVCESVPGNTHFTFDLLISSSSLGNFLDQENFISFSAHTYFKLRPGADPDALERAMPDMVKKFASGPVSRNFGVSYEEYLAAGNGYHYFLQALPDIYLHSNVEAEIKAPGSITRVYLFMLIAGLILLIACINFMNLATARSVERAKEVGIRKTLGSARSQLAAQFLIEAIAISLLSTLLAGLLVYLALPAFNALSGKEFASAQIFNFSQLPVYLLLAIGVGLLAGSYPALVLSSFRPLQVLRGRLFSTRKGAGLRNGLVVFQFVVSVGLIISTLVIYQQMTYIQNRELGFNKSQIISLRGAGALDPQQTETFKAALANLPGVEAVGGCNDMPGGSFFGISFKAEGANETVTGRGLIVDDTYIDCMEMEMADGRSYDPLRADSLSIVINEAAARELGLKEAIGHRLTSNDDFLNPNDSLRHYTIVGVVKDFHFQSLHQNITPLFFVNADLTQGISNIISLRVGPNSMQSTLAAAEGLWTQMEPDQPFRFTFLERDLTGLYERELVAQKISSLFSLLAIFIACMGLLGLAAYITQRRSKEIGIRKVLGASVTSIIGLLSRDFLKLVLIGMVIAFVVSGWAMYNWLQNFAYHVELAWWIFALAGLLALFIAFFTVSFQSVRAALANPIRSLRDE